ncbi:hypothetical protein DSL72_003408 [Monilinia vaccinii-corymbosi]|uniref:Uncharacterized protein n=1 Tax=Monilinia vaccinii-corymbosi TaxID=61207 RepID=A0A8A3NWS3_9HELO|nr:hypothetical protein DSL72_003408 [Monilinia vaccinii-corymbosi]
MDAEIGTPAISRDNDKKLTLTPQEDKNEKAHPPAVLITTNNALPATSSHQYSFTVTANSAKLET